MATITVTPSSYVRYVGYFDGSGGGTATATARATTSYAAQSTARTNAVNIAKSSASQADDGPKNITSSQTLMFGITTGTINTTPGSPTVSVVQEGTGAYLATAKCSWYSTTTNAALYQLKIKFSFPNGISSNDITSVKLKFSYGCTSTASAAFAVAGPASTTELNTFWNTNTTDASSSLAANYTTFDLAGSGGSVTLDVTSAVRACYQYNQPYLLLRRKRSYPNTTNKKIELDGVPTLEFTTDTVAASYSLDYDDSNVGVYNLPLTQTITGFDANALLTVSSLIPHRTGYKFMGWTLTEDSSTVNYVGGDTVSVAKNTVVTLYPVWLPQYIIGVNTGDGLVKTLTYVIGQSNSLIYLNPTVN